MTGRIFVIGASLSGIDALCELLSKLPVSFPAPIFVTQHVAAHSPGMLPRILAKAGPLPASHPRGGELIASGHIYVAPPDRHMLLREGYIALSHGPRENHVRPAIDPLFRSAALAYGPAVVGVVLTGQLDDGTAGLLAIKDRGGTTIVQNPLEATAPSMPVSAMRHVKVDHCCTLAEMARLFVDLASDDPPAPDGKQIPSLIEIEDHIAEGTFSLQDWLALEQSGAPCGLNCPDCHSALYELNDKRFLRFRCRAGHAYSAQTLLSTLADAREIYLSTLFGAVMEEAALVKRMRKVPAYIDDSQTSTGLDHLLDTLKQEATQVSEWLRATGDLVAPEPGLRDGAGTG